VGHHVPGDLGKFTARRSAWTPPFFNKVNIPIGLFLLFLTGVGPLFAWRRTSVESLRRNFQWPGIASVVLVGADGRGRAAFYALISFGFCLFVALTMIAEFWKGARAIRAKNKMNLARAMVELTHRNTRRYGGYLVHMGIVLMFIGFTGAAFNRTARWWAWRRTGATWARCSPSGASTRPASRALRKFRCACS
jgi:cytochrome c biogenesis factor